MSGKVVDFQSMLTIRAAMQDFLEKFCVRDRREITDKVHKNMMLAHFYFVDYANQGWYVLDDPSQFHKELTQEEYWIYGTLWEKAVAYE